MRKIILLIFLAIVLFIAGCGSQATDQSSTEGNSKNKDPAEHWPASAMHPTHTVYSGSGIEKCGTSEEGNIFDACRGLKQDESWSFTFNEKGEWNYHDHLTTGLYGKAIV